MFTNQWLNDHSDFVPSFGPSPLHQRALGNLPLNALTILPLCDLLPFTLPSTVVATKISWRSDPAEMIAVVDNVLAPYIVPPQGCWFRPLSWDALEQTICFSRTHRMDDVYSDGFGPGMYASDNLGYALSLTAPGAVLMVFHNISESNAVVLDLPKVEWFRVVDKFLNVNPKNAAAGAMSLDFNNSDFIRGPVPRRLLMHGPPENQFEQSHITQICARSRKAFAMLNSSLKAIILFE
ncbi:uncharacterized protein N7469_006596 [Penicillium citrinum]|uniref:Uncharacterized protein n=1 Tax=Penicillium citrinum TaxID=5077 RepID=A0A9W9NUT3_PENCI|nr:uncharacterized protein N7469_006596 [Penicillium citrinum]KAJ5226590.1 hypothetical protein N7469_006596 [Penicillium citrinum]KAK5790902.1 hypothetical protein VI817_006211 [Penicillium citrinum]